MADLPPKLDSRQPATRGFARRWRDEVSAEWGRFTAGFTRENVVSRLKTLAWVVPLTLLIWIYAEREQVRTEPDVSVPFELVNNNPDRSVWLKPPQDKNLVLNLHGPQARLQAVINDIRGGKEPDGLRLETPANLETNREHTLDALSLIRNQRLFAENGITVVACQPARLQVQVDQLVDRDAKVVKPPQSKNIDATFDPPTVKIRGPLSLLNRAEATARPEDGGAALVVYADLTSDALKSPGHYDLPDVLLRRPPELDDERVTIVAPTAKIRASVDVRQADKTLPRRSLPVTLDVPDGLLDRYKVVDFKGVVQNVTLSGPPEVVDLIDKPGYPQPKARLAISTEDANEAGTIRSKVVQYDLPPGWQVSDEDRKKTVEFRLVDRATTP